MNLKQLQPADWALLLKYDQETFRVPIQDRRKVVDPESAKRLVEAGVVEKNGTLKGVKKILPVIQKLEAKMETLKKGVPFKNRSHPDPAKAFYKTPNTWETARISKKDVITNRHSLLLGKPIDGMKSMKGEANFRQRLPTKFFSLVSANKHTWVPVEPKVWQVESMDGLDIIWMAPKDNDFLVPIQAMYFDLLEKRFPTCEWWGAGPVAPVIRCTRKKGYGLKNGVVGLIMPLTEFSNDLPIPQQIEDIEQQGAGRHEGDM